MILIWPPHLDLLVIKKGGFSHQIANVWINIKVSKFDLPSSTSLCLKKGGFQMPKLYDLI